MVRLWLSALLLIAFTGAASAHGIWIAQRHGQLAVIYGHGGSDEAYDPSKLKQAAAYSADDVTLEVAVERNTNHATLAMPKEAIAATAFFDNGYWTQGPDDKWVNQSRDTVDGAKKSGRYLKYASVILGKRGTAPKPRGLRLEIVPLVDPMALNPGDRLPIQVLHNGTPIPKVPVTSEYTTDSQNKSVVTDENGRAEIIIRNLGLNVIAVSFTEETREDPKADKICMFSTLSFTLDYGEE